MCAGLLQPKRGELAPIRAVRAAGGEAPARRQPGAAAAVATAGSGAPRTAFPAALRSSRSGPGVGRWGGGWRGAIASSGQGRAGEGAAADRGRGAARQGR